MSRPYFDRTAEFRSAVESAAFRAASSAQGAPLLANGSGGGGSHGGGPQGLKGKTAQRSEFARMAAKIGKDIQATTGKLEKLAQRGSPPSAASLVYPFRTVPEGVDRTLLAQSADPNHPFCSRETQDLVRRPTSRDQRAFSRFSGHHEPAAYTDDTSVLGPHHRSSPISSSKTSPRSTLRSPSCKPSRNPT